MMRVAVNGFFWFLSLGVALFSLAVVLLATASGFDRAAPHLAHYAADHRLPIYAHMVFGSVALFALPFQFWQGMRDRHRPVHRGIGYAYVVSVGIAGTSSLLLLPRFAGSAWAATGFGLLAILWMVTTARALVHARAGRTADHRVWMMRSAALTFAAVVLRLMLFPLIAAGMTLTQAYDIVAWACWIVPVAFVEWRLRRAGEKRGPNNLRAATGRPRTARAGGN